MDEKDEKDENVVMKRIVLLTFCIAYITSFAKAQCPTGEIEDCNGNCAPEAWLGDGLCDYGQREYNGVAIVFACQLYECDYSACNGPCEIDGDYGGIEDPGACCIAGVCSDTTRANCWAANGQFMGANTLCQTGTCGCGVDWITDCSGNCIRMSDMAYEGGCLDGGVVDYGDGEIVLDLNCQALACGLSGCVGNCPGACCVGGGCQTTGTYDACVELGGLFLGSYVECNDPDASGCAEQLQPVQLPDTELEWSGALGEIHWAPQWLVSEGEILIEGAVVFGQNGLMTGVCVYRFDDSQDAFVEEALLTAPSGNTSWAYGAYTTDGDRIAVTSYSFDGGIWRNVIDIFVYSPKTEEWSFEQTIDDGDEGVLGHKWGETIDINGDVLVVGDPGLNSEGNVNGGAAHVYRFDGTQWELQQTLHPFGSPPYPEGEDYYLGKSVAVEGDVVAVSSKKSLLIYDISTNPASEVQHIREMDGHDWPQHRAIDLDDGRLLAPMAWYVDNTILASKIFEFIDGEWTETAVLIPFDVNSNDDAGYIVDLDGDRAMITSPRDNDLGLQTGSAYMWEHDGAEWKFEAKLWSDRAVGGDQFGISATMHGGNAYLSGAINDQQGDNIKVFWPRGIAWVNADGGNISFADNWDPVMPTTADSVSFSLRSHLTITVDEELPFSKAFIGPGNYVFDLAGVDRQLGNDGVTLSMRGVPGISAEFVVQGGTIFVNGDVLIGDNDLPGKVALISDDNGVMGQLVVDGTWLQHDAGELFIELNVGRPAPLQLYNNVPSANGVLTLVLDEGYVPQDGDIIPLMLSEFIDETTSQFSIVIVDSPLPEGLYIKLNYIGEDGFRGGGLLTAEVELLSNLFDYGNPNSETIIGTATDVVIADLGSVARTADGFDDIVITTTDVVHVFLSDGNGGFASQVTYSDPSFTSLSAIDAGDLDGDGTIDLVMTNASTDEFIPMFNESQDITQLIIGDSVSTGPNPTDILAMNTDADSDADVIVACYGHTLEDGEIDFYESVPAVAGLFIATGSLLSPGNPGKISPGDVNTDKDFPIIVSFGTANMLRKAKRVSGARGGNWEYVSSTNVSTGPSYVVSGDLDNDTIEDIVVSCPESDVICIVRGNLDGSMATPLQLYVGKDPMSIELLDYDNDGDLDIAVIATDDVTDNRAVMMYRNDTTLNGGNFMFAEDSTFDDGLNPVLVAKGDIDGDGHDDLISVNNATAFRGVDNSVFLRKSNTETACSADFDGNGIVDILDLLAVIGAWGNTGETPEDLDGNGVVDILDVLTLISAWGPCS